MSQTISGSSISAIFEVGIVEIRPDLLISSTSIISIFGLGAISIQVGAGIPGDFIEANFQVNLDVASPGDTQVVWFTQDGTAISGEDYLANSGVIKFPAGSMSQRIQVYYRPPNPGDNSKWFNVVLSSPYDAVIKTGIAVCTIPSGSFPGIVWDEFSWDDGSVWQ